MAMVEPLRRARSIARLNCTRMSASFCESSRNTFPFDHLHASTLRGAHRLGITDGYAVEEVKIVTLQRLHHFLHTK
ncbi:hypothetical protein Q604_UNBC06203G0001, partial [human gut metagenome]